MRYRTRHNVVDAIVWNGPDDTEAVKIFLHHMAKVSDTEGGTLEVHKWEGGKKYTFIAEAGDFFVKMRRDVFYIFKPDDFHAFFSAVHADADKNGIRRGEVEVFIGVGEDGHPEPCHSVTLNGKSIPILTEGKTFSLTVSDNGPAKIGIEIYGTRMAYGWNGWKR